MKDFTEEAEELFRRFADRHGFHYEIERDVPMEVCWIFPAQDGLSLPITLGLQNSDELNFGVSDFWSYFFPLTDVADQFESIINAWVSGDARVAVTGIRSRLLQIRDGDKWKSVYGADGCLFPFKLRPFRFITNSLSSAD